MDKEKLNDYMPEAVFKNLFDRLFPGEHRKALKVSMITSIVTAFLCYFMLMVTGYSGPDSNSEGVLMYRGFGWALSIGRWFIGYVQTRAAGSAIIPFLIVMMYSILVGISAVILCRMFNVRGTFLHVLITALFVSFPIVELHFGYLYMAVFYAFSFFCVVAGTLLARIRKVWGYIAALLLYIAMLGSYQSYIGGVAALAVMLLIYDMSEKRGIGASFADFGATAAVGAVASVLDLFIVNFTLSHENLVASDRVAAFSFKDIMDNLQFSLIWSFKWFFYYFRDGLYSRNLLYNILFVVLLVVTVLVIVKLFMEKKTAHALIIIPAMLLIPYAMNIVQFLFPHNGVQTIMRYHYVLVFVFGISLLEKVSFTAVKVAGKWVTYIALIVLLNTYILSANIGGLVYKAVYTETYTEAMIMMERIYELDGYKKNETKVVLASIIDWSSTCQEFGLLLNETSIGAGPVFWEGVVGLGNCRQGYFLSYLGINVGAVSAEEINSVMQTEEYAEMPVWPAEGSVRMINGYAVIKNIQQ